MSVQTPHAEAEKLVLILIRCAKGRVTEGEIGLARYAFACELGFDCASDEQEKVVRLLARAGGPFTLERLRQAVATPPGRRRSR